MGEIHRLVGTAALYYALIMGLWGLFLFLRRQPPSGSFLGAAAIVGFLFAVQALIGIILFFTAGAPSNPIHLLYGVCTLLTPPFAFVLARNRNDATASLIYGLALMFLWGLALRAFDTAPTGVNSTPESLRLLWDYASSAVGGKMG